MAITPEMEGALGPLLAGGIISMLVTGIVCLQLYLYLRSSSKDRLFVKGVVILVALCQVAAAACIAIAMYQTFVLDFGNPNPVILTPALDMSIFFGAISAHVSEAYFIYRLQVLMGKLYLSIPLWAIVATCYAFTMAIFVGALTGAYSLRVSQWNMLVTGVFICAAAVDTLTALLLCAYMRRKSSMSMDGTKHLLDKLSLYAIQTGLVTSILAIIAAITLHCSKTFIFLAFYMSLSGFFANALLASLNRRMRIRMESSQVGTGMSGSTLASNTEVTFTQFSLTETAPSARPDVKVPSYF